MQAVASYPWSDFFPAVCRQQPTVIIVSFRTLRPPEDDFRYLLTLLFQNFKTPQLQNVMHGDADDSSTRSFL